VRSRCRMQFRVVLLCAMVMVPLAVNAGDASLYERIGGRESLASVVDAYVDRLSQDPRTKRSFDKVDLRRVKRSLAQQLCELTGGPCRYTGDSMREIHAGHGIDEREFLRGVELLREVLVAKGIALRERNQLLALLAPMKGDVVEP